MKGAGAGLVLQVARVTSALREASGPLSIREAARLLNLRRLRGIAAGIA